MGEVHASSNCVPRRNPAHLFRPCQHRPRHHSSHRHDTLLPPPPTKGCARRERMPLRARAGRALLPPPPPPNSTHTLGRRPPNRPRLQGTPACAGRALLPHPPPRGARAREHMPLWPRPAPCALAAPSALRPCCAMRRAPCALAPLPLQRRESIQLHSRSWWIAAFSFSHPVPPRPSRVLWH
jgi:hypothetical protein